MSTLTAPEALVGVAWTAACADDVLHGDEMDSLQERLQACHALARFGEEEMREALVKVEGIASREGDAALLKRSSEALPPELRATAFYWGADLVMADGHYGPEEVRFVERLRTALSVPEDLAARILDVIHILRRG